MSTDGELDSWRREWRTDTEPLPALKRKMKRQNRRMGLAAGALCVCLVWSVLGALSARDSFGSGFAVGVWFATFVAGGYGWWIRRGAWKPVAQTTAAYIELLHRRAIAKARSIRFGFWFLLIATVLYGARWTGERMPLAGVAAPVLVLMLIELFVLWHLKRRAQREVGQAGRLMAEASKYAAAGPEGKDLD